MNIRTLRSRLKQAHQDVEAAAERLGFAHCGDNGIPQHEQRQLAKDYLRKLSYARHLETPVKAPPS